LLEDQGRVGLNKAWTITPVGGSDKVPTFVALIGAQKHLNVAVLIDYQKKDQQVIENLYKKKLLTKKQVVTFAEFTGGTEADIEDMFDVPFYLGLVNDEYGADLTTRVTIGNLVSVPRVVRRLEEYFAAHPLRSGREFNHYRPARYFAENVLTLKSAISAATLDRFEAAFRTVNALL